MSYSYSYSNVKKHLLNQKNKQTITKLKNSDKPYKKNYPDFWEERIAVKI